MIEFALLFGLGFLSAALVAMMVTPAIHRRIVHYTESRIRATLPISPQEVRAQRDMARAVYAAENARTKQELVQERDKTVSLQLKNDTLIEDARKLHGENAELQVKIDTMDVEAAEARARLREEDGHVQKLRATIDTSEEKIVATGLEVENLRKRQAMLIAEADNLRIDLSTRDTEVENLKFRIKALRDERDALRDDVRLRTTRAKDAENRLTQEETRVQRLEDKLAREISERADRETALDRRLEEIARLRDKLKVANADAREAVRNARENVAGRPVMKITPQRSKVITPDEINLRELPHAPPPRQATISSEISASLILTALASEAHNRSTALSERLLTGTTINDEAIRQEMAAIAANMVALTAAAEGSASPINKILSGKSGNGKRESLAARSKKSLASTRNPAG